MDDHAAPLEVDVLPPQREQFAEAHAGVGRNAVELAVLTVLPRPPLDLARAEVSGLGAAVSAGFRRTSERLNLLRLEEVKNRRRRTRRLLVPVTGLCGSA